MLRRLALCFALFFATSAAWADDTPKYAPAPDWVTPAPAPDPATFTAETPLQLILDQQQRFDSEGGVWAYFDVAMRMVSSQMLAQAGTVQLPWQPADGDLIVHSAEILRGGETIDLLAQGEQFSVLQREEQLEQLQMTGVLTATMTVEGLRVGDVLRVRASVTRKDPALSGEAQSVVPLIPNEARLDFGRVRLLWPSDVPLQWKLYSDGVTAASEMRNGMKELSFTLPLPEQPDMPPDAPARFQKLPLLDVTTFDGWAEVSRVMAPLYRTEGTIAPNSPLAGEVARIAAATQDPRERAAMALRLVQDDVRYLYSGMDGGAYRPQSPQRTWEARYGDCKAKTLLLLALLDGLGIEAEAVLAQLGQGDFVTARLPLPGAFNHVLVRARVNGESLWLDGTGTGARLGDLGDVPPLRHVLPVRADGATLETLPARANARPDTQVNILVDHTAGITFPSLFEIELRSRGPYAEMLRTTIAQATAEQKQELVRGMIYGYFNEPVLTESSVDFDEASGLAIISAKGLTTTLWEKQDGRYRLPLDRAVDMLEFEPNRALPAWRDIPVATGDPVSMAVTTTVRLPPNLAVALEGDTELPAQLAGRVLARSVRVEDGTIISEDRWATTGGEIPAAEVAETSAEVARAKTRLLRAVAPEDIPPHWRAVRDAKRSGRLGPLRALYDAAVANEPEEALPYQNRAAFLRGTFEWREAIADLDKAIAIEPSVDLYGQRAGLYRTIGEDALALADLERARALAPGNGSIVATMATIHSEAGEFDAALALLDPLIAAGGRMKPQFQTAKADVLADAGRVEEAIALLDAVNAANPSNPMLLNSRCWLKGTRNVELESALRDCTRAIELAQTPASVLDSRAMVWFRMERYAEALADLDAALDISSGLAASLYLRGIVHSRMGDTAAANEDIEAATLIAPRIAEEYARYGIRR